MLPTISPPHLYLKWEGVGKPISSSRPCQQHADTCSKTQLTDTRNLQLARTPSFTQHVWRLWRPNQGPKTTPQASGLLHKRHFSCQGAVSHTCSHTARKIDPKRQLVFICPACYPQRRPNLTLFKSFKGPQVKAEDWQKPQWLQWLHPSHPLQTLRKPDQHFGGIHQVASQRLGLLLDHVQLGRAYIDPFPFGKKKEAFPYTLLDERNALSTAIALTSLTCHLEVDIAGSQAFDGPLPTNSQWVLNLRPLPQLSTKSPFWVTAKTAQDTALTKRPWSMWRVRIWWEWAYDDCSLKTVSSGTGFVSGYVQVFLGISKSTQPVEPRDLQKEAAWNGSAAGQSPKCQQTRWCQS